MIVFTPAEIIILDTAEGHECSSFPETSRTSNMMSLSNWIGFIYRVTWKQGQKKVLASFVVLIYLLP